MLASSGRLHSHLRTTWIVPPCVVHPCLRQRFKCGEGNLVSSPCATAAVRKKASAAPVGPPARQQPTAQQQLNDVADKSGADSAGQPGAEPKVSDKEDENGVYWDPAHKRWIARLEEKTASGGSYKRLSFSAALHGVELAKQMAIAARQESLQKAPPKQAGVAYTAVHQSRVKGVSFDGTPGAERWLSSWQGPEGRLVKKSFSVKRLGLEVAKRMAEQARLDAEERGEAQNIKRRTSPDDPAHLG